MSIVTEKRSGGERRLGTGQLPVGIAERRIVERRQIRVSEISFIEWAMHFANFQRSVTSKRLAGSGDIIIAVPLEL